MKNNGNTGKKILSLVLTLAMVIGMMTITEPSPAKASGSKQIVYSYDFENGGVLEPTKGTNAENVTDDSGNHYMKVTGEGQNIYKMDPIKIIPGQTYTLSYRIKVTKVENSTTATELPGVNVRPYYQEWATAQGQTVGKYEGKYPYDTSSKTTVMSDWETVSVTYTPTAGKNYVQFFINQCHNGNATYQIDDIELYYHPDEKNQIVNGEFDSTTGWYNTSDAASYSEVAAQGLTPIMEKKYILDEDFSGNNYSSLVSNHGTSTLTQTDDALKVTGGAGTGVRAVNVPVTAGVEYTISYDVKIVTSGLQLNMFAQSWDSSYTDPTYFSPYSFSGPTDWVHKEMTYTVPEGQRYMQYVIYNNNGKEDYEFYIDNFQIYSYEQKTEVKETMVYDSKGFEEDPVAVPTNCYWKNTANTTPEFVSGVGVDSGKALQLTPNNSEQYVDSQYLLMTKSTDLLTLNQEYIVKFKVRGDAGVKWRAYYTTSPGSWDVFGSLEAPSEWTEYSYKLITTEDNSWRQIGFQAKAAKGSLYVDDFQIIKQEETKVSTYTEGIGDCGGIGNALAMDEMSQVSYPVTITTGKEYYYSYRAKAVDDETATVKAIATNNTADEKAVTLTTEWQDINGTFIATKDGDVFGFDKSGNGRVLIDDVVLYEKLPSNPTNHTYATGGGHNMPENAINLINNGNFENGTTGHTPLGTTSVSDGMAVIKGDGTNQNYIQVGGATLTEGNTYTFSYYVWITDVDNLTFDMYSAKDGGGPSGTDWHDYGFTQWTCTLDGEVLNQSMTEDTYGWRRVEVTWTAKSSAAAYLGLKIYGGYGTVYIDDVALWDNDIKEYVTEDITTELSVFEYYTGLESYLHLTPKKDDTVYENPNGTTNFTGNIIVNGVTYESTYKWDNETILLNFVDSNFGKRMSETEVNTVKIPAETKLVNKDTTGLRITNESIFYVQMQSDQWMLWTSESDYGDAENANVQYQDMGAGIDTYTFTANPSANIQSAVVVTGPQNVSLKSTQAAHDAGEVSKTVDKLGDYAVKKTTKNVLFDYTVALYKRGNVHLDGDGYVTSAIIDSRDLVALKKAVADSLTGDNKISRTKAADANADGKLDAEDATILRRAMAYNRNIMATTKGESLLGQGVMPIIGFDGPDNGNTDREKLGGQKDMITEDIYDKIQDLGFNMVVTYGNNYDADDMWEDLAKKNLEYAQQRGIKAYLQDGNLNNEANRENVTDEKMARRTSLYDSFTSFAGYFICDEPLYKESSLGDLKGRPMIERFTSPFAAIGKYANVSGYMNLYPAASTSLKYTMTTTGFTYGFSHYQTYVNKASEVGADTLTYDMYLRPNKQTLDGYNLKTEDFYENLDWMRKIAQSNGKPFQTFVQVGTDFESDNTTKTAQANLTTIQEMFLEATASLAMGSKGINYYSLIAPAYFVDDENKTSIVDNYRAGLINVKGEPNNGEPIENQENYDYYNAAKKINTFVAKVDHILMSAESKGVVTMNEETIKKYIDNTAIDSYGVLLEKGGVSGDNAFVGCFDYYGKDAYLVVNTSTTAESTIRLTFSKTVNYDYYDMDSTFKNETAASVSATIPAGECVLIVMK